MNPFVDQLGTISAWAVTDSTSLQAVAGWLTFNSGTQEAGLDYSSGFRFRIRDGSETAAAVSSATSTGVWYHLVGRMNGSTADVFANGTKTVGNTLVAGDTPDVSSDRFRVGGVRAGAVNEASFEFNGRIDEVRLRSDDVSDDWVSAEYTNQSTPTTFYTIGSQVDLNFFAPTDISGLQLWLDASDASTITESSGAVSQWDDKSGNANHVTQGTAALQPTTGTRTQNSLNVLDFDGSDFLRNGAIGPFSQPNTVFVVGKADATATTQAFVHGDNFANDNAIGLTSSNFFMFADSALFGGASDTSTHIFIAEFNSTSSELFIDGVSSATGDAGSGSANDFRVGARYDGAEALDGFVAEVLVYDSALSTADREAVEAYLADKWGITLS